MNADIPMMHLEQRDIARITPHPGNPRRISEEAVNAVAESIRRFGYRQPIVVDEDGVIVVGHTRRAALLRLGTTGPIAVAVARGLTPEQIDELRLVDNRVAEFTSWDYTRLAEEIEGMDEALVGMFFPELSDADAADVVDLDLRAAENAADDVAGDKAATPVRFVCPHCMHGWTAQVTEAQIARGMVEA